MIITLGQQSLFFDADKIYELFKIKDRKELEKAPPQVMLYVIYQVQEKIMTLNRFNNISKS